MDIHVHVHMCMCMTSLFTCRSTDVQCIFFSTSTHTIHILWHFDFNICTCTLYLLSVLQPRYKVTCSGSVTIEALSGLHCNPGHDLSCTVKIDADFQVSIVWQHLFNDRKILCSCTMHNVLEDSQKALHCRNIQYMYMYIIN